MKEITRQEVIEKLIEDDIDTIQQDVLDTTYIHAILNSGFKGYNDYTKEELYQEYKERFNEGVKINEMKDFGVTITFNYTESAKNSQEALGSVLDNIHRKIFVEGESVEDFADVQIIEE